MKTDFFRIFNFSTLVPLGVAIAAALVTQTTRASVIHNLVVTENSSTSLTATYDNSTARISVTPVGQDEWKVRVSSTILNLAGGSSWAEPSGLFNSIIGITFEGNEGNPTTVIDIRSDTSIVSLMTLPNGGTVTAGTDNLDGAAIKMTFTDRGDVAGTPDKGSTFDLLFLSLAALFGARHFRFREPA